MGEWSYCSTILALGITYRWVVSFASGRFIPVERVYLANVE
jgi:hypothetical protein